MSASQKELGEFSRKELLSLPSRAWDKHSIYDSVLIMSTRKKHESGWAAMAIIGVNKGAPIEIATQCSDDIEWKAPIPIIVGKNSGREFTIGQFRMDCLFKSSALHAWGHEIKFKVGNSLSSIDIEIIRIKPEGGSK